MGRRHPPPQAGPEAPEHQATRRRRRLTPRFLRIVHFSLASTGAIYGVLDTLNAIGRKAYGGKFIVVPRVYTAVSKLVRDQDRDENKAGPAAKDEQAWQLRVALRIAKHGDKPITRELLVDLIAEELPWRKYLKGYAEKWASTVPTSTTSETKRGQEVIA